MRTVRDYVKEMCLKGRTDEEVVAVARATNWKDQIEEVKDWLNRRGDVWRAKGGCVATPQHAPNRYRPRQLNARPHPRS